MSDLAPFVAAALRDKTVLDLQEELAAEKEKVNRLEQELRVIRITGPGGFPVHAERHFQHADQHAEGDDFDGLHSISLQNPTERPAGDLAGGSLANPQLVACQIQDVNKCELHIGGKEIIVLGDYDYLDDDTILDEGEERDWGCHLTYDFYSASDDEQISLSFEFGPVPDLYPTETDVDVGLFRNEDIEFLRFLEVKFWKHPFNAAVNPST